MHSLPHKLQHSPSSVRRDAWVEVSLSALEHNWKIVRGWMARHKSKPPLLMSVVKSDAYGHGAPSVAELFEAAGADYLGVASLDEGTQLRNAGIKAPIFILSPTPSWSIDTALDNRLDITVASLKQCQDVANLSRQNNQQARIHLKVDTGMHRLGVSPDEAISILDYISTEKSLKIVSVFSHLAMASEREAVQYQDKIFARVVAKAQGKDKNLLFHLASSEAARLFDSTHYDMVRIGLYQYGLAPDTVLPELKPALSVKARINHIGTVPEGESAGYGWTWTARRDSRLATIPIGYADGVDRGLSNIMEAMISVGDGVNNNEVRLIKQAGRISMDQMLFDITDVPEAQEGDVITLIGESGQTSINLSQWAESLATITYELACRLRARLPRVYTRSRLK